MNKYKADVVIVGGGIAGITAAIELLNLDKKVILFDRDEEEKQQQKDDVDHRSHFYARLSVRPARAASFLPHDRRSLR